MSVGLTLEGATTAVWIRLSIEGWPGEAGFVAGVAAFESPGVSERPQAAKRQVKVKAKAKAMSDEKAERSALGCISVLILLPSTFTSALAFMT
jgi:hypothetical protein